MSRIHFTIPSDSRYPVGNMDRLPEYKRVFHIARSINELTADVDLLVGMESGLRM